MLHCPFNMGGCNCNDDGDCTVMVTMNHKIMKTSTVVMYYGDNQTPAYQNVTTESTMVAILAKVYRVAHINISLKMQGNLYFNYKIYYMYILYIIIIQGATEQKIKT